MKKIFTFLAVAALVAGCSKMDEAQPSSYTITGYTTADTRTAFGTPDATSIPFLWSAGDKVWVNGVESSALTGGGQSATFTLASEPSNGAQVYYNRTGSVAQALVPTEQDAQGTLGANGDFGYATLEGDSFTLKHATSYLWFDVQGMPSGAILKSIRLHAGDAIVAGSATWNGSAFGAVSNGRSIIDLTVNKAPESGEMLAMVVLPTAITEATITYELRTSGGTKFYEQTLGAKTIEAGKTYKISVNLPNWESLKDYTLRTLTFEDNHALFNSYTLASSDTTVKKWSDLIDNVPYGGDLLYGGGYGSPSVDYYWYDEKNTGLKHQLYGTGGDDIRYYSGGHAISNYIKPYYSDDYTESYIREYYEDMADDIIASAYGGDLSGHWYYLQLLTPIGGNNDSNNFAVHHGYADDFNTELGYASYPSISFAEGEEYVVDHMYITNTNYVLHSLTYGDGFNTQATESTTVQLVAEGYDANGNKTGTVKLVICDGTDIMDSWEKWNLSELGEVNEIVFGFQYTDDQTGQHGFNCPAYFAYDDVAVQWK